MSAWTAFDNLGLDRQLQIKYLKNPLFVISHLGMSKSLGDFDAQFPHYEVSDRVPALCEPLGKVLPLQVASSHEEPLKVVIKRFGDTEPEDQGQPDW